MKANILITTAVFAFAVAVAAAPTAAPDSGVEVKPFKDVSNANDHEEAASLNKRGGGIKDRLHKYWPGKMGPQADDAVDEYDDPEYGYDAGDDGDNDDEEAGSLERRGGGIKDRLHKYWPGKMGP